MSHPDIAPTFQDRHIGPSETEIAQLLEVLGYDSLDALVSRAVPSQIRTARPLNLPAARAEQDVLADLRTIAGKNRPRVQMIGLGYYDTITPAVLRRNILEAPGWYTSYTPYQPEISQGRLEALLTFQTVIEELTGLPVAGASLLDEATAVAEAVLLMRRANKTASSRVLVDAGCFPQTLSVLRGRADAVGIELVVTDLDRGLPDGDFFGVVYQNPSVTGGVRDLSESIAEAHRRGALTAVATDLLALTLVTSPGEQGADIAVGSAQRFGVPLFFGGPHAGFISVRNGLERMLPGRLVGVSKDADGTPAYRLALQTREQHIRRDKATSNICTAQVLLAVVASMYAVYHGPDGLRQIALRTHRYAAVLATALREAGMDVRHEDLFDTVTVDVPGGAVDIVAAARERGIHLRLKDDDTVGISTSETTSRAHLVGVLEAFGARAVDLDDVDARVGDELPVDLLRETEFLTHEVFNTHRSETSMLRYLRRLSARDYALDRGMIPLGSCTMKLNATTEMEPIGLPGFADLHPFAPAEDALGYQDLIEELESWLAEVTGYDRVSIQPNAGSQGELAGLLAIRAYHVANGEAARDICLIPASAHGTNAASPLATW